VSEAGGASDSPSSVHDVTDTHTHTHTHTPSNSDDLSHSLSLASFGGDVVFLSHPPPPTHTHTLTHPRAYTHASPSHSTPLDEVQEGRGSPTPWRGGGAKEEEARVCKDCRWDEDVWFFDCGQHTGLERH